MKAVSASIVILGGAVLVAAAAVAEIDDGARVCIAIFGGFLILLGLVGWIGEMVMDSPKP